MSQNHDEILISVFTIILILILIICIILEYLTSMLLYGTFTYTQHNIYPCNVIRWENTEADILAVTFLLTSTALDFE